MYDETFATLLWKTALFLHQHRGRINHLQRLCGRLCYLRSNKMGRSRSEPLTLNCMECTHFFWADMLMRGGYHPSGKGAAVFVEQLLRNVDSGMGSIFYLKVCTQFDVCFSFQINFVKCHIYLLSTATCKLVCAFLCIFFKLIH